MIFFVNAFSVLIIAEGAKSILKREMGLMTSYK